MRLWHYKLIPYLPKQQLVGQWRELNSIYKKQDKHILINYIYEYTYEDLFNYSYMIILEMKHSGFKVNTEKHDNYFKDKNIKEIRKTAFRRHHDQQYLKICCWNLYEKFIRGQSGFTDEAIDFILKIIGE